MYSSSVYESKAYYNRLEINADEIIITQNTNKVKKIKENIIDKKDIEDFQFFYPYKHHFYPSGFIYFKVGNNPRFLGNNGILKETVNEYSVIFDVKELPVFLKAKTILSSEINKYRLNRTLQGNDKYLTLAKSAIYIEPIMNIFNVDTVSNVSTIVNLKDVHSIELKKADNFRSGILSVYLKNKVLGQREICLIYGSEEQNNEVKFVADLIENKLKYPENPDPLEVTTGSSKTQKSSLSEEIQLIEKLAYLRDQGILTEDEFILKKREILGL